MERGSVAQELQSIALVPPPGVPLDDALRAAMERYHLELVGPDGFDDTYDRLAAYFGPSAEIEPREVLREQLRSPRRHGDIVVVYLMIRVVDRDGSLVAIGDGRYVVGPDAILGMGSNFFTDPAHRGSKVASAVDLASKRPFLEHVAALTGRSADRPCLIVADVDPLDPRDPVTLRRLELWGRCHWSVVPPRAFPFALLGQSDPDDPDRVSPPVPNLLMVRAVDGSRLATLDRATLLRAADLMAATAADHAPAAVVRGWVSVVSEALAAWPDDVIPLLPLPARGAPPEALAPLLRSALLEAVPAGWRRGEVPDPEGERAALWASASG